MFDRHDDKKPAVLPPPAFCSPNPAPCGSAFASPCCAAAIIAGDQPSACNRELIAASNAPAVNAEPSDPSACAIASCSCCCCVSVSVAAAGCSGIFAYVGAVV